MAPRDERFGPHRRVKKRTDFLRIQGAKRKSRTPHLLFAIADRTPPEEDPGRLLETRIGITVTKKVHKRAVRRNRVKRRLREIFRRIRWRIQGPVDIVVICLEGSVDLEYDDLHREMMSGLRRAGLVEDRRPRPGNPGDGRRDRRGPE